MNLASLQSRASIGLLVAGAAVSAWVLGTALVQHHHVAQAEAQQKEIADSQARVQTLETGKTAADKQAAIHEGEQTTAETHAVTHKRELAHLVAGLATVKQLPPESKGAPDARDLDLVETNAALEKAQEVIADQDQQNTALKAENAALRDGQAKRDQIAWEYQKQARAAKLLAEEYHQATNGPWAVGIIYHPEQLGQPQNFTGMVERQVGRARLIVTGDRQGGGIGVLFTFGRP